MLNRNQLDKMLLFFQQSGSTLKAFFDPYFWVEENLNISNPYQKSMFSFLLYLKLQVIFGISLFLRSF